MSAAVEDGRQVRLNDMFPLRIAHICQQSDIRDAGIVDQYIQITACAVDVPEYLIRLFRLSHIAKHDITGAMIGSLYGMLYLVQIRNGSTAVQKNMIPSRCEIQGSAFSNSPGSTCNQNRFFIHLYCPLSEILK